MIEIAKYPIKYVSSKTGLSQLLIRTWENRYNVVTPERTDTNRRLYSEDDLKKLQLIKNAIDNGFKISNLAQLNTADIEALINDSTQVQEFNVTDESLIDQCLSFIRKFDADGLQKIIDIQIIKSTKYDLITEFIYPLLLMIGTKWEEGELTISHEHFASAVIRNSLGKLIDTNKDKNLPTILVGTPSKQNHELMALAISVLLAEKNYQVIYLGPSIPAYEIISTAMRTKAVAVILSFMVFP